jgi:VWFA-related protein
MRALRASSAVTLALLLLPTPGAHGAEQEPPPFTATTSVVAVTVPVQVTRDGMPVRGLTLDNFEVFDGKQRQVITAFEVVDLESGEAPASADAAHSPRSPVPFAGRRHFLLLFDLTFAEPASILRARQAARELVRTSLHPSDLVGLATYSATAGSRLALGFTADRGQVDTAIETLGLPQLLARFPDPLTLILPDVRDAVYSGLDYGRGGSGSGRGRAGAAAGDLGFLATIEDLRTALPTDKMTLENQVIAQTRALGELGEALGAIDGRKTVVFLSEGFEGTLMTGRSMDAMTAYNVSVGRPFEFNSDEVFGSTRVQNEVANLLEALRRADCVVHAVDIGGARAGGTSVKSRGGGEDVKTGGLESLLTLAKGTGGELYQNFNDLEAALGKMLQRTSVTYLLTVQPQGIAHDGSFHELTVRLRNAPRARVQHRAGFFAPDPRRPAGELEQRLGLAEQIQGGRDGGELPLSVLAVPLPGAAPSRVPLVVEVDGQALLAGSRDRQLEVEIYAYAMTAGGGMAGYLTQQVDLDLDKVEGALRSGGLKFVGDLELPAGDYSLRVLVRNASSGARGLRTVPLRVETVASVPHPLPPMFPDPLGKWLLARQDLMAEEEPRPFPFTAPGEPFLPAARPVVTPGTAAPVTVLVYDLATEQAQVSARVADAQGAPVAGGELRITAWRRGEDEGPGRLEGSFTAIGLAPGEYQLRVAVTDPTSGATSLSSPARFLVGGG